MKKLLLFALVLFTFASCEKEDKFIDKDFVYRSKFRSSTFEVETPSGGKQTRYFEVQFYEGKSQEYLYWEFDKNGEKVEQNRTGKFSLDYPKLTIGTGIASDKETTVYKDESSGDYYFQLDDLTFKQIAKFY